MDNIWEFQNYNEAAVRLIHEQLGVSILASRLLVQRGVNNVEDARYFLYAGLDKLTDPWQMRGMDAAVERIEKAIQFKEKVIIYGDYDVDGVCSIVILHECLQKLGCRVDYYVPNRFGEGYGLNIEAVQFLVNQGYQLLITVDCGISSVEETELAIRLGMDVIITDHHTPSTVQPPALAVINPKNDAIKEIVNLAGAGVTFKLATALATGHMPENKIYEWLDLVALATVADIVPLVDENRLLVKYGLRVLKKSKRTGLKALIHATGLTGKPIRSWQVGFMLAPRLNSAGRLDSARISIELLLSRNEQESLERAALLCKMNDERRLIEEGIYQEALKQIEREVNLEEAPILIVGGEGWHEGVIGIVASRLVAAYNRPTIVISWADDIGKASARSIGEFDLYMALNHVRDYLLGFGGHMMAAGLSIKREQLGQFKALLKEYADQKSLAWKTNKRYQADVEIEAEDIRENLLDEIESLGPFGEGNPVPHFVLRASAIRDPFRVGNNKAHLKFKIGISNIEGIAFNRAETNDNSLQSCGQDLLFELDRNDFRGNKSLQLKVKDLKATFILDKQTVENNNLIRLTKSVRRAVQEIDAQRPVIFTYPTYRSLRKHQAVMEYFFNKCNVQILHGHLEKEDRIQLQNQLARGVGKVFMITRAFLHYYQNHFNFPANLRYIVRMWPGAEDFPVAENVETETIEPAPKFTFYRSPGLAATQGRVLVYANLPKTVKLLKNNYPKIRVESGLMEMRQRRAIRREYLVDNGGVLLSDGTHTAGWNHIRAFDEMILADSPLGLFELAAYTDYLTGGGELRIGVAFEKGSLEYNRNYLQHLYPNIEVIKGVMTYLRQNGDRQGVKMDGMPANLNMNTNKKQARLEMLSALRILADLGLCRFRKSGSIMPINREDTDSLLDIIGNSLYYLEGIAEKEVLNDWEMLLNKGLEW